MKKNGLILLGTFISILIFFAGCDSLLNIKQLASDKDITYFCFEAANNPTFGVVGS